MGQQDGDGSGVVAIEEEAGHVVTPRATAKLPTSPHEGGDRLLSRPPPTIVTPPPSPAACPRTAHPWPPPLPIPTPRRAPGTASTAAAPRADCPRQTPAAPD